MTSDKPSQMSRGKRAAFSIIVVTLVLAIVEFSSFAFLAALYGGSPSGMQETRSRRDTLAAAAPDAVPGPQRTDDAPRWIVYMRETEAIHPYVGFVADPTRHRLGADVRIHPDWRDLGFVKNIYPLPIERSKERLVVGVFGGSVAVQTSFGDPARQMERLLEDSPRFAGRDVEVFCFASGGYKQPQQLMILNYLLALGMKIDIAINLDGFNDVTLPVKDNIDHGVFPFYPRSWSYRVDAIDPEERLVRGEITSLSDFRHRVAAAFASPPWRHSATATLLWSRTDRYLLGRVGTRERDLVTITDSKRLGYQASGPTRVYATRDAMFKDLAEVWQRSSTQMRDVLAGHGAEYYHFLQPNQYLPGSKVLTAKEKAIAHDQGSPFFELVPEGYPWLIRTSQELHAQNVPFRDLSDLFADESRPVYVDKCCHFNRRGVLGLVQAMAETVIGARRKPSAQR